MNTEQDQREHLLSIRTSARMEQDVFEPGDKDEIFKSLKWVGCSSFSCQIGSRCRWTWQPQELEPVWQEPTGFLYKLRHLPSQQINWNNCKCIIYPTDYDECTRIIWPLQNGLREIRKTWNFKIKASRRKSPTERRQTCCNRWSVKELFTHASQKKKNKLATPDHLVPPAEEETSSEALFHPPPRFQTRSPAVISNRSRETTHPRSGPTGGGDWFWGVVFKFLGLLKDARRDIFCLAQQKSTSLTHVSDGLGMSHWCAKEREKNGAIM